eukprot:3037908-Amphidinium_carterae.1
MSLDGSAGVQSTEHYRHRDLPPLWDGVDPARRWRAFRRELLLWQADTEVPPGRQAVKAFRQMSGQAKLLAESITDRELISPQGLQLLIGHFDALYEGAMKVTAELDFDAALFTGYRQTGENFLAFVARKTIEFARYENGAQCQLPDQLKAKVLLRQCKATEKQMQRLLAWLDGKRTEAAVKLALGKLDTDLDVTLATSGGGEGKSLWQAEEDFLDWQPSEEEPKVKTEDPRYDSDDDSFLWIFAQDTNAELDEEELQTQLVNFSAVQRAKQAHKVARGWSHSPSNWKGKSKGKGKGLRTSDYSGKGKGKKGDGKAHFGPIVRRDERRQQGMTRVSMSSVAARVRCWRCGQMGHMAKDCHQGTGGNPGGYNTGATNAMQQSHGQSSSHAGGGQQSSKSSSKGYFVGFTWQEQGKETAYDQVPGAFVETPSAAYFVTSPEVAIVDTGAVNGIVGVTQFEILCRKLAQVKLEAKIDMNAKGAPKNIGGIGGGAAVVCTAIIPTSLNDIPGLISFIVITGEVPALLPLPLMKALGAVVDLPHQHIYWQEHPGHASLLQDLPTGHLGCSILEGIEKWQCLHPHEEEYRLKEDTGEKMRQVRQRAKELLLVKNGKYAAHYVFDGQPSASHSCLPSSSSNKANGSVVTGSQEGVMPTEDRNSVRDHRRSQREYLMGETDAENGAIASHGEPTGNNDGVESSWSTARGEAIIEQHIHGNDSRSGVCKEPSEQPKRSDGIRSSRRMSTPTVETKRQCASEMVLLHEVSEEMASERRGIHLDGVDNDCNELEAQSLEELYEVEWSQPTLAECQSLTKSYFTIMESPAVYQLNREEAEEAAAREEMTGRLRVLNTSEDYIKGMNSEDIAQKFTEVCTENSEDIVQKLTEVCVENPEVNLERVRELCLLEQQGETRLQDGDLTTVWNIAMQKTRLPVTTWEKGTCIVTHAKTKKGKALAEPVTFSTPPYRLSVMTWHKSEEGQHQALEARVDNWLLLGRKKREKLIDNNAMVVLTIFFQDVENAKTMAKWVSTSGVGIENLWQEWMRSEVQPRWTEGHALAGMEFNELLLQLFESLRQKTMPPQHRPLVAVQEGSFSTFTLGASTQRGPKITKALRSGLWSDDLCLIHELARRRPDHLQKPYLAIAINRGGATAHTDTNDGITNQRPINVRGTWKDFDASIEHQTTTHTGERFTISLYVPRKPEMLRKEQLDELQRHGFPIRWFLEEHAWRQRTSLVEATVFPSVEEGTSAEVENLGGGADDIKGSADWTDEVVMEVPSATQRKSIMRAHCNLGHCSVPHLIRAMKFAGVRPGIRLWVKREFHCNECASRGRIVRRPATLSKSFQFNQVVGLDTIHVTVAGQPMQLWLNMVDFGTRFQQVAIVQSETENPTSEATLEAFESSWVSVFGLPESILTDLGSEFKGMFAKRLEEEGVQHLTINSKAPWEQGITERTGGLLKEQIRIAADTSEPTSPGELRQLVRYAVLARNQHTDRSGYAPAQRVYGQLPAFPLDLVDDSYIDADVLALGTRQEMRRSAEIRSSARMAFFKLAEKTRYQRAERAATVPQPEFKSGDMCFVLRRSSLSRQWREGPGIVVQVLGATAWVAIRGELLKCSKLALLKATSEDQKGVEAVKEHMPDLLQELSRHRSVRDVTNEEQRLPGTPVPVHLRSDCRPHQYQAHLQDCRVRQCHQCEGEYLNLKCKRINKRKHRQIDR